MYATIGPSSVQFTPHATKAKINAFRVHSYKEYIWVCFGGNCGLCIYTAGVSCCYCHKQIIELLLTLCCSVSYFW